MVSIFSYHRNQYLWIIHHSRLNRRFWSPRRNIFNFVDELLEIQRSTLYNKNITRFELVQPISLKCFYKVQNLFIFLFVFLIKSICICCAVPDLPAPDPRYYVGLMIARRLFPNFLSELFWTSSTCVDFKMFLFFYLFYVITSFNCYWNITKTRHRFDSGFISLCVRTRDFQLFPVFFGYTTVIYHHLTGRLTFV